MGKALHQFVNAAAGAPTFQDGRASNPTTTNSATGTGQAIIMRHAGVWSRLGIYLNDVGTTRSVISEINDVDGNQIVSFTDGVAAYLEDTTNSDSVSVNDLFGYECHETGSNPTYRASHGVFAASSGTVWYSAATGANYQTASTTFYAPFGVSSISGNTTESYAQSLIKETCTAKFLAFNVGSNTRTNSTVVTSRKNGADGNQTLTINAAATGLHEDTTNSDSLVADDLYCVSVTLGTDAGAILSTHHSCFENTTDNKSIAGAIFTGGENRAPSATTHYWPLGIIGSLVLTDTTYGRIAPGYDVTFSNYRLNVSANTLTGTMTVTSEIAGSAGNLTLSLVSAGTGWLEDTTHTDDVGAAETFAFTAVGGTLGSLTCRGMLVTAEEQAAAAAGQPTVKRAGGVRYMRSLSPVGEHSQSIKVW